MLENLSGKVHVSDLVSASGSEGKVSSTGVRAALTAGDMPHVERLLGRPYRLVADLKAAQMVDQRHIA